MKCPNCNADVSEDMMFCRQCGTKLEKTKSEENKCFQCGEPLKPGAKFCTKCGANQAEASKSDDVKPVEPAPAPEPEAPKPAPAPKPEAPKPAPAAKPAEPVPAPELTSAPANKSSLPIVLLLLVVLLIAILVGGYFVLDKVYHINVIEMVTGKGSSGKGAGTSGGSSVSGGNPVSGSDAVSDGDAEPAEDENLLLLKELRENDFLDAKQLYEDGAYQESAEKSRDAIDKYIEFGDAHPDYKEQTNEYINEALELFRKTVVTYCNDKSKMNQDSIAEGASRFEQIQDKIEPLMETARKVQDKGYSAEKGDEIAALKQEYIDVFRQQYITWINYNCNKSDNTVSRTVLAKLKEQIEDTEEDLFDEDEADDELRLRYKFCYACALDKEIEGMSDKEAYDLLVDELPNTDYNPWTIMKIVEKGKAAKADVKKYSSAYNAIADKLSEQGIKLLQEDNTNDGTNISLNRFWYFNDLDSEDYKEDVTNGEKNGTTGATREWIRDNIPDMLK